jgi:hypothetical protein
MTVETSPFTLKVPGTGILSIKAVWISGCPSVRIRAKDGGHPLCCRLRHSAVLPLIVRAHLSLGAYAESYSPKTT